MLGCLPDLGSHAVLSHPDAGGSAGGVAVLVGLESHADDASCVWGSALQFCLSEQVAAGTPKPQLTLATAQLSQDSGEQSEVHSPMAADAAQTVAVQPTTACLDCGSAPVHYAARVCSLLSQQLSAELDFLDSSWRLQQHLRGQQHAAGPALLVDTLKSVQDLYKCWGKAGAGVGCEAASQGWVAATRYQKLGS